MEFLTALLTWLATTMLPAFAALVGVGALVTALVALGKKLGVIKDGESANWSNGANLILFAIFVVATGVIGIPIPPNLDLFAGLLAQIIMALLGLFAQAKASGMVYRAAKAAKLPLLGFSFS